ncbi:hypothetical protein FXO38_14237 [Capsicum annuum]|nr:hypothetical protein FXO37_27278 [Capsicum annuum]KAF3656270.1 hypothetical protein FXO38_14237 [Capsicum annuum]
MESTMAISPRNTDFAAQESNHHAKVAEVTLTVISNNSPANPLTINTPWVQSHPFHTSPGIAIAEIPQHGSSSKITSSIERTPILCHNTNTTGPVSNVVVGDDFGGKMAKTGAECRKSTSHLHNQRSNTPCSNSSGNHQPRAESDGVGALAAVNNSNATATSLRP